MTYQTKLWTGITLVLFVAGLALMMNADVLKNQSVDDVAQLPEMSPMWTPPKGWKGFENKGTEGPTNPAEMFSGVRQVPPAQLHQLIPQAQGKPLFIQFHSKFCLDCKRMKPVIEGLLPQYPGTETVVLDIQTDRKKQPALFKAFEPSIVPILIFVQPDGTITNVLYGYHSKETLSKEFRRISAHPEG